MMMTWISIVLVLLQQFEGVQPAGTDSIKDLVNSLFSNYSTAVRPVKNQSEPTMVIFGMELIQILDVDERSQLLTTKQWIRQQWRNELLAWDPTQWGGIDEIKIDAKMLWVPEILLYNSGDHVTGGKDMHKTKVRLSNDGICRWYSPAQVSSSCMIDVSTFPFDKQSCLLKFGPWTNDIKSVDMMTNSRAVVTSNYIQNSEWELISGDSKRNARVYASNETGFVDISFTIVIHRKPLFFLFNAIIPCIVLMLLMVVSFLLPPESGERISLTITVFLAVTVFQQLISSTLPRNSESVPSLVSFYALVMFGSAMSLLANCFVLRLYYSKPERPIPRWVQSILLRRKKSLLPANDSTKNEQKDNYGASPNTATKHEVQKDWRITVIKKCAGVTAPSDEVYSHGSTTGLITRSRERVADTNDWHAIAAVADKFLFWSFFVGTIVAATLILLPNYLHW